MDDRMSEDDLVFPRREQTRIKLFKQEELDAAYARGRADQRKRDLQIIWRDIESAPPEYQKAIEEDDQRTAETWLRAVRWLQKHFTKAIKEGGE